MVIQVVVQVSRRPQGFMPKGISGIQEKVLRAFLSVILLEILPCSFFMIMTVFH